MVRDSFFFRADEPGPRSCPSFSIRCRKSVHSRSWTGLAPSEVRKTREAMRRTVRDGPTTVILLFDETPEYELVTCEAGVRFGVHVGSSGEGLPAEGGGICPGDPTMDVSAPVNSERNPRRGGDGILTGVLVSLPVMVVAHVERPQWDARAPDLFHQRSEAARSQVTKDGTVVRLTANTVLFLPPPTHLACIKVFVGHSVVYSVVELVSEFICGQHSCGSSLP